MRLRALNGKWLVESGGGSRWLTEKVEEATCFTSARAQAFAKEFDADPKKPELRIISEFSYTEARRVDA